MRPKLRSKRGFWTLTIAVLVIGVGGFFGLKAAGIGAPGDAVAEVSEEEGTEEESRVPVALATVRLADMPDFYHATGTIEARRSVDLNSRAVGQITKLVFEEGDWVEKGQELLEIDPREQELLVEEARARAQTTQLQLARTEDMSKRGLGTDRALEEARQGQQVDQSQYELARVRLDDHFIRAPFSGRVTTRYVELGQTVQVGAQLLGLADVDYMQLKLFLPEKVVRRLTVGQVVEVRPDVDDEKVFEAVLLRIAPVVDAATSTVKVTLRIDDPSARDHSGSFVRARVTTDVHEATLAVPRKALVSEAGATFLFVAEADSVRRVDVVTGYSDDDFIEVSDGVEIGESVVVVGQGGLRNGSRIEQLPEANAAGEDDLEDSVAEVASN